MTKADIVEAVYQKIDLPKKESADLVDSVFEMIRTQLEKGESVKIPRFGNFTIRSKVPRRGRNPKTGEEIEITARKVLTFKPSQILRDRVNQ
ncbi:MAG: integration host factor subunit alpha [Magnetococcales bacterium]|nr:integration host factor subunit alpha [Magnetococcales bacterium]